MNGNLMYEVARQQIAERQRAASSRFSFLACLPLCSSAVRPGWARPG
jgi:hypothetical protein